jgi:hypothetical protein
MITYVIINNILNNVCVPCYEQGKLFRQLNPEKCPLQSQELTKGHGSPRYFRVTLNVRKFFHLLFFYFFPPSFCPLIPD